MKVSIITATYNSAGTVRDTIESVNRQTYADMEHIIVDGASMKSLKNIRLAQRECLQAFRKYNLKVNRLRYFVGRYCWKLSHYSVKTFLKDIKNK